MGAARGGMRGRLPRASGAPRPTYATDRPVRATAPARRLLAAFPYLLPALGLVGLVFAYALVRVIQLSFARSGAAVGLENYRLLLDDPVFLEAIGNNLKLLLAVPIMVAIALPIAMLLHERPAGWRIYRTIIFLPYIVAIPVAGIAIAAIVAFRGGLNELLSTLGLDVLTRDWLGSPATALWVILGAIVWREVGLGVVLFLARLIAVDPELFEAARIDGAGWWQQLRLVALPQLRRVVAFYIVIETITVLVWTFAWVFVLTRGGPAGSTMVVDLYIFQQAILFQSFGIAASAAALLLLTTVGLLAVGRVVARSEG